MEEVRGRSSQTDNVHGDLCLPLAHHSILHLLHLLLRLPLRLTNSTGKEILQHCSWTTALMKQDQGACDLAFGAECAFFGLDTLADLTTV